MSDGTELLRQFRASIAAKMPAKKDESFIDFAKRNLQIRTVDNRVIPFELRPIQIKYLEAKRAAVEKGKLPRYLLLKYRRGGFTTVEQAQSYALASRNRNINVLTLAQDGEVTARIFRIPVLMHQRDPEAPAIKGIGNQYKLEFPALNSLFYVGTAAGRGVGRGDTLSRVHWSEVAWSCLGFNQVMKQRDILTGLSEAASHGEMVLETTPNGSEMFREMYQEAKQGKNDWTPIFLPWFVDHTNRDKIVDPDEAASIVKTMDDDEQRLVAKHGLDPEQLKWRRRKKRELKRLFPQEYPEDDETCWLVSGTPFFDPQVLLRIRDFCRQPEMVDAPNGGSMPAGAKVIPGGYEVEWEKPMPGVLYALGADTSEGLVGCDPSGIGVMRRDNGKQVKSLHGIFTPRVLADHIVRIHKQYNDALVGIERENHGHAVIQKVIDLGLEKPHHNGGSLYYHGSTPSHRAAEENRVARAGWTTNVITRPIALEGLREWMEAEGALERIMDRQFLAECMTFRLQADGTFAADPGSHDDSISKWSIANQMRVVEWRRARAEVIRVSRWRRG